MAGQYELVNGGYSRGSHHHVIELNGQEVFFKNYSDLADQYSEGEVLTVISNGECNRVSFVLVGRDQLLHEYPQRVHETFQKCMD